MKFHEVASIFPMMSDEEFSALKADIQEHGLRESIWVYDGKIIDGRNRYQACAELGIRPKYANWDGNGSLVAFVVSLNLHRRHLNESQRAMVGGRIKPMFEDEAKQRQRGGQGRILLSANLREATSKSSEQAAQSVNVSPRSVESASKVIEGGAPEIIQSVDAGKVSVSVAAEIATLPKEEQTELAAYGEAEILKKSKEIKKKRKQERLAAITEAKKLS